MEELLWSLFELMNMVYDLYKFFLTYFNMFLGEAYQNDETSLVYFNKFQFTSWLSLLKKLSCDKRLLNKHLIKYLSLIFCHVYPNTFYILDVAHLVVLYLIYMLVALSPICMFS